MNNRYLYRAKRTDNGEWVEGYLFDDGFENGRMFVGGLVIEEYKGTACDDWSITGIDFYEVDPSTICQCTGLKDKNGKLIWENDIVICFGGESFQGFWEHDETVKVDIMNWQTMGILTESEFVEVIRTVFDNPELSEVGE